MVRGTVIRIKYVQAWVDKATGKTYYYYRRAGWPLVRLRGLPGSEIFMADYRAAEGMRLEVGAKRFLPGSVSAAVAGYFGSALFHGLAPSTQRNQRRILEKFREENSERSIRTLTRADVQRMIDNRSSPHPNVARDFLKALRSLMRHAIACQLRGDNPCDQVRLPKAKSAGFHSWTEEEIAIWEKKYPIGTRQRLAFDLLLYTAQRRSDVVTMGRQHLREGVISVTQRKTGISLAIPVHPRLQATIGGSPNNHLTFLVTEFGKPFSVAGFGNIFRDWVRAAGLPARCAPHGLRKAACRRLAEAGCNEKQIAAISGHQSLAEIARYTKAASQKLLATAAIKRLQEGSEAEQKVSNSNPAIVKMSGNLGKESK